MELIPCKIYNIQHIDALPIEQKVENLLNFFRQDISETDKENLSNGKSFVIFRCKRDTPRSNKYAEVYCKYINHLEKIQQEIISEYQKENPGQIVGQLLNMYNPNRPSGCLFSIDPNEF